MKDITQEYTRFQRGMQFYNCPNGIMINKDNTIHSRFKRNFSSEKIESEGKTFHRTGEIFEINNEPIIVYKVS